MINASTDEATTATHFPAQPLADRLLAYLDRLDNVNQRWFDWLGSPNGSEQLPQPEELGDVETASRALFAELELLVDERQQILASARQAGWSVSTLQGLARRLPQWRHAPLRASFEMARQQLDQLRRLHVAAWVTLNQSATFYNDTTRLLMCGSARQDVYLTDGPPQTGGQLLDTNL